MQIIFLHKQTCDATKDFIPCEARENSLGSPTARTKRHMLVKSVTLLRQIEVGSLMEREGRKPAKNPASPSRVTAAEEKSDLTQITQCDVGILFFALRPSLAMDPAMAAAAQSDQILVSIVSSQASWSRVVDFKKFGCTALLTSPAIPLEHPMAKIPIGFWV
jgi:hypothetical protein